MGLKAICKLDIIIYVVVLMIIFIPKNSFTQKSKLNISTSTTMQVITTENGGNETTSTKTPQKTNQADATNFLDSLGKNKDMLLRALYVLISVTTIVIIYFGIKAWRVHRRKSKSRKYGIITKGADLEMEPLGKGDEDEEDLTVFEINNKSKKK